MRRRKPGKYSSSWIRANLRWALYLRDDFHCAWCGQRCEDAQLTLDHLFPRKHPQRDNHPSRLVTACVHCNLSRKGLSLSEWLKRLRETSTLVYACRALRRRHAALDRVAGELKRQEVRFPKGEDFVYVPGPNDWFMDERGVCW